MRTETKMRARTIALVTAALLLPAAARAEEARSREAARAAVARSAPALVTVRMTLKTRYVHEGREGQEYERTLEVQGTVVSADGLTVVSDLSTDPESLFPPGEGAQVETEASDVKLLLRGGQEVPARFVLRDPDLDLAFLAPVAAQAPMPFLKLERGAVPAQLDELLVLAQLGPALGREVAVQVALVRAVVKKPRTFLVPTLADGHRAVGGPALDARGRPIGLVVFRRPPGAARPENVREYMAGIQPVVLTAADLLEVAEQASAARIAAQEPPVAGALAQP